MLSRSILGARTLSRSIPKRPLPHLHQHQNRNISVTVSQQPSTELAPQSSQSYVEHDEELDPEMTGGYVNPLPQKRSLRDPYEDWWDKQERRNFGEPVHEDNDILGVFSTEPYNHFSTGWGAVLLGTWCAGLGALLATVYQLYPDKPSVPRTFSDGLEKELGGPGALSALENE